MGLLCPSCAIGLLCPSCAIELLWRAGRAGRAGKELKETTRGGGRAAERRRTDHRSVSERGCARVGCALGLGGTDIRSSDFWPWKIVARVAPGPTSYYQGPTPKTT